MGEQVLALFGHGVPLDHPLLAGLAVRDLTRVFTPEPEASRIAPMLEPFLDPFVRSFLFALERGLPNVAAVVIWRQGPGALHAYRYAQELRRLGLLPDGPPLLLWNTARGDSEAARTFDAAQVARLKEALTGLPRGAVLDRFGPLAALEQLQSEGQISGAEAQRRRLDARASGHAVDTAQGGPTNGPRLALAGAPLGNAVLQEWLDRQGALVLDLTGIDAPEGDLETLLRERRIEHLVWQVDPHDDLHGWRRPGVARLCEALGIRFTDLGFLPAWPQPSDLAGDLR
ncbi:hypothetical protein [Pararhodobacter sp. CCB-MM2]|uniref:hypothetical protein n=1 Tax=Pararhodobacter sp. CCB-MM2 TaxID=1786003 RepID=UPI0008353C6F|nr:hypothetical protein [Pararhodobacter sp. CCB-MM2]